MSIFTKIIAIVMLLWALADNPYSYYQILRVVVCCIVGYLAYVKYTKSEIAWAWVFGFIALLFNPIIPVHYKREAWIIIDIIVAVILMASIVIEQKQRICKVFLKIKRCRKNILRWLLILLVILIIGYVIYHLVVILPKSIEKDFISQKKNECEQICKKNHIKMSELYNNDYLFVEPEYGYNRNLDKCLYYGEIHGDGRYGSLLDAWIIDCSTNKQLNRYSKNSDVSTPETKSLIDFFLIKNRLMDG